MADLIYEEILARIPEIYPPPVRELMARNAVSLMAKAKAQKEDK